MKALADFVMLKLVYENLYLLGPYPLLAAGNHEITTIAENPNQS
jgi:hypothetical protein